MFIGLDLGTSGLKGILIDSDQGTVAEATAPLSVSRPHDGWSEQVPADWIVAAETVFDGPAAEQDLSGVAGRDTCGMPAEERKGNRRVAKACAAGRRQRSLPRLCPVPSGGGSPDPVAHPYAVARLRHFGTVQGLILQLRLNPAA